MSDDLEKVAYTQPDMLPVLVETVTSAKAARDLVGGASEHDGIEEIHAQLIRNRGQIERLEYLVSNLLLLRTRTARAVAQRKAAYDDAYMQAATKKSVGFSDFASAKQQDAHAQLGTVEETMHLRKAETMHRDVEGALEYCRMLLRGAQDTQRDVETRIRLMSLRSQLER